MTDRIKKPPVSSLFSKEDLEGKRVYINAEVNGEHLAKLGELRASVKGDTFFIDLHYTEKASENAYDVTILHLNQRLVDMLSRAVAEEYDFTLLDAIGKTLPPP